MKITKDMVLYVAHLARLELTPTEIEAYTGQLDRILEYMDKLNTLNTEGIEPMSHPMPVRCVMREDLVRSSFDPDDVLKNAPEQKANLFKVPAIIEVEK